LRSFAYVGKGRRIIFLRATVDRGSIATRRGSRELHDERARATVTTEPTSSPDSVASLLALAHTLADRAGAAILPYFRQHLAIENKGGAAGFDPVTEADKAAERAMREHLAATAPAHGIIGEEYADTLGGGRFRWVLDPIDGTKGFITGLPTWGTLVGLLEGEEPVLGLMDQPYVGERFWSSPEGAHLRRPDGSTVGLATRPCSGLREAVLSTTHPALFGEANGEAYARLRSQVRLERLGADCYAYCMVAAGQIDLVVEAGLQPHDVVALIPIIERAGGVVTTWDGDPATAGGRIVAAGDRRLHAEAMRVLTSV
jgi:histidinol phosphatase-like enzyme (inositol monophosphatase family)